MKKTRFTESQIVVMLKEYEGGKNVDLICRDAGSVEQPFTNGKANTVALRSMSFSVCVSLSRRIFGSRRCTLT
jgi:hypothetical protein